LWKRLPSRIQRVSTRPHHVHGLVPDLRPQLSHDSRKMIFHCKFRNPQVRRNFFVRHSLGHQLHQLALPSGQAGFGRPALHLHRLRGSLPRRVLKQPFTQLRRAHGFPACDSSNRRDHFRRRRIIQHLTTRSSLHRPQKRLGAFLHPEQQRRRPSGPARSVPALRDHPEHLDRTGQRDIARLVRQFLHRSPATLALSHHRQTGPPIGVASV